MPRKPEKPPFEQKWKELADKTREEAMNLPRATRVTRCSKKPASLKRPVT